MQNTPVIKTPNNNKSLNLSMIQKYGMILVLILITIIFSILSPHFFTYSNVMNIIRQISIVGIIAAGQTLVIISGGIDLSVGSIVAFSGMTSAMTLSSTGNVFLAILVGLLVGTLVGFFNGVFISKLNLAPFIVTLASMIIFSGLTLVVSDGNPIIVSESAFKFLGQGYVGPIPFPVILLIIVYLVMYFILKNTIHGQYVYSIGGNERATILAGVNVTSHKILIYTISGLLSGLAAIILTGRLSSATPIAGTGYEMDAIAAVILGGASLSGGKGNVSGTLIGVLILGVLTSGMNLINVSPFLQDVAKGLIILIAVIIDRFINTTNKQ